MVVSVDEPSMLFVGKVTFASYTELVVESLSASTKIIAEDLRSAKIDKAEIRELSENLIAALTSAINSRVSSDCCSRLQTSEFVLDKRTCSIEIHQYSSVQNKTEILQALPELYNLSLSTLMTTDGAQALLLKSPEDFSALLDAKIRAIKPTTRSR